MTDVNARTDATSEAVHDAYHPTGAHRWWTLALLCSAFFVVVSDSTIVYAALPSIRDGLSISDARLQ